MSRCVGVCLATGHSVRAGIQASDTELCALSRQQRTAMLFGADYAALYAAVLDVDIL